MVRHFPHYVVLFGIFATAIGGFILFSWDKSLQIGLVVATAFSYVAWGIVHHFLHDDLYPEVVIEYIAVAALGSVLLLSVLLV